MSNSFRELLEIVSRDADFAVRVLEDVVLRGRGLQETLAGRAVRAHEEAALHVVRTPNLWGRRGYNSSTLLTLAIHTWECAALEAVESRQVRGISGALRTAYIDHAAVRERVAHLPEVWQVDGLWRYVLRASPKLAVRAADELIAARDACREPDAPITWSNFTELATQMPPVGLLLHLGVAVNDFSDTELAAELQWFADAGETEREAVILLCREAGSWLAGRSPRALTPLVQSANPDIREAAFQAVGRMR